MSGREFSKRVINLITLEEKNLRKEYRMKKKMYQKGLKLCPDCLTKQIPKADSYCKECYEINTEWPK